MNPIRYILLFILKVLGGLKSFGMALLVVFRKTEADLRPQADSYIDRLNKSLEQIEPELPDWKFKFYTNNNKICLKARKVKDDSFTEPIIFIAGETLLMTSKGGYSINDANEVSQVLSDWLY